MIAKLITILLLSLLLVLAALFMLAKAKKEQLGKIYSIAASVAAAFGMAIFIFGITAGIMMFIMHRGGKHPGCGPEGHCMKMKMEQCEMKCDGNETKCKSSCDKEMEHKCGSKKSESCSHGEEVEISKEVIIKEITDGDGKTPEVKIEVEKGK